MANYKERQIIFHVLCICNRMGPRAIKDKFHAHFQVFTKLPESRSDEGNLENFENASKINP